VAVCLGCEGVGFVAIAVSRASSSRDTDSARASAVFELLCSLLSRFGIERRLLVPLGGESPDGGARIRRALQHFASGLGEQHLISVSNDRR
jgi:hypothetical protein